MPPWLLSPMTKDLPHHFLLSLSRDCNLFLHHYSYLPATRLAGISPLTLQMSLYCQLLEHRTPPSPSSDPPPHQCPTHTLVSLLVHVQTGSHPSYLPHPAEHWKAVSLLWGQKDLSVIYKGTPLCKSLTSLRSSFLPWKVQPMMSASQSGCQHEIVVWKCLMHSRQSSDLSRLYQNPLKHLTYCVQWSNTMSSANNSETQYLCVQNRIFPMEKYSALHEVPW